MSTPPASSPAPEHLIRCTSKLLVELGSTALGSLPDGIPLERQWQANIFRAERRKCLIFTHCLTLYSFFILGVTKKDLTRFGDVFAEHLHRTLSADGLTNSILLPQANEPAPVCTHKSHNSSLLASMNNLVFMAKGDLYDFGFSGISGVELSQRINEAPMGYIGYESPYYRLRDFLREKRAKNAG